MTKRYQPLHQLERAVKTLEESDRGGRDKHDVAGELVWIRRIADRLEMEFARVAGEFERTYECGPTPHDTPLQWIRDECHTSTGVASNALAVGAHLDRLHGAVSAMEAGEISFQHVALMAHTADDLINGRSHAAGFDETRLLAKARDHNVGRFRRDCRNEVHKADAKAFLEGHRDEVAERFLEVSARDDGCVWLRGFLDSVGGSAVRAAISALAVPMGKEDTRQPKRRNADALVELIEQAVASGARSLPGDVAPQVQVTVSLDALRDIPGSDAGDMEFAGAVPAATAQRLACDATITRVLLDSGSVVRDVGRGRRLPATGTRRALAIRDGGCVWPGCSRPASWTQAHHVVHWAQGGATEMANLVLLCRRHHWKLHEGGWQLHRADDGRITLIPPLPDYTIWPRAPAVDAA